MNRPTVLLSVSRGTPWASFWRMFVDGRRADRRRADRLVRARRARSALFAVGYAIFWVRSWWRWRVARGRGRPPADPDRRARRAVHRGRIRGHRGRRRRRRRAPPFGRAVATCAAPTLPSSEDRRRRRRLRPDSDHRVHDRLARARVLLDGKAEHDGDLRAARRHRHRDADRRPAAERARPATRRAARGLHARHRRRLGRQRDLRERQAPHARDGCAAREAFEPDRRDRGPPRRRRLHGRRARRPPRRDRARGVALRTRSRR